MTTHTLSELKAYCAANNIAVTGDRRRKATFIDAIAAVHNQAIADATAIEDNDATTETVAEVEAPQAPQASITSDDECQLDVPTTTIEDNDATTLTVVETPEPSIAPEPSSVSNDECQLDIPNAASYQVELESITQLPSDVNYYSMVAYLAIALGAFLQVVNRARGKCQEFVTWITRPRAPKYQIRYSTSYLHCQEPV